MAQHTHSPIEFVERYGDPVIAGRIAADQRRHELGRALAFVEGYLEGDPVPHARNGKISTAGWLAEWARMRGYSEQLVSESYIDYWFLHTVVDHLGDEAARAGISMQDFISAMNQPLVALRKISPDKAPPRLLLSQGPADSKLLAIDTPRHLAAGMIPGLVRRLSEIFMTRCGISIVHGSPLPCWQLAF